MYDDPSTLKTITQIQAMEVPDLKALWLEHFETMAPNSNRQFLARRLIQKVQVDRYGDLPACDRKILEKLAGDTAFLKKQKTGVLSKADALSVGTRLVREYRGIDHEVTVTASGFIYQGQPYRSLSAIATKITGTKWSGQAFFGLKKRKAA
jgi:hypothetical protein